MSLGLEKLSACLQGIVPSMLFTCSKSGIPNAAYLSHVDYVDPTHVALSFQFFNKSRRNIAENPQALVHVIDPDTAQGWKLRLRYVRSETTGPVFDRMALRIEAIASYTGLKGIFRLLASDIYEVQSVEPVSGEPAAVGTDRVSPPAAVFTIPAMQDLTMRIQKTDSLESLLDSILLGFEEFYGFGHSMILLAGEKPGSLITIASRGYPEGGTGAEARFGEGIIGLVAEARKPVRISGLLRGMLYAYAVQKRAAEAGLCPPERQIALPGMPNPVSQLGIPLVAGGDLVGVLCVESETHYRFHEEDKTSIELLGSYLAIAIQNAQLREEQDSDTPTPRKGSSPKLKLAVRSAAPTPAKGWPQPSAAALRPESVASAAPGAERVPHREVTYHRNEEVILVDGEYLIRSLPARILWKLLSARTKDGREEFTNRELRLDKSLNLPGHKDNLETRLLLLRRRLVEKCPDIRLVSRARGRFALDLGCEVTLTEHA